MSPPYHRYTRKYMYINCYKIAINLFSAKCQGQNDCMGRPVYHAFVKSWTFQLDCQPACLKQTGWAQKGINREI